MTTTTSRRAAADSVVTGAVQVSRDAAIVVASRPEHVGEHLGVEAEAERLATHRFTCADPAYRGWHWAVTVARVSRSKAVTVCEVVLLPGDDALLSGEWLPWSQRLAPGDLGVGDLLATDPDDDRLEPGYTAAGVAAQESAEGAGDSGHDIADDDTDRVALWELGLGRERVLSEIGRDDAVDRWYSGDHGPHAPLAEAAPAHCSTCGFLVALGGALRRVFGVCANAFSPSDGKVVSYDHGCGAHSEVATIPGPVEVAPPMGDEETFDVIALHPLQPVDHPPSSVDETPDVEDLGHS